MEFIDKQVAPPKSWEKFEDLTRSLFAAIWCAPLTQKHGRSGQAQHGVDIFGTPADAPGRTFGVQCKGKDGNYGAKATIVEFDAELAKAERFRPALAHWTFATTAPNDGLLQRHAQQVSEQRERQGRFPVAAIGWETIQALLSGQSKILEEFYPEHTSDLRAIMTKLRSLPPAEQLDEIWRNLRALAGQNNATRGPADVGACPLLPEAATLLADLERAGTARLAGVAGAGKSICTLQVARQLHDRGWRVLRLADPMTNVTGLEDGADPALYIVDDAHLMRPQRLRELEDRATETRWVLSAHTTSDGKGNLPGTVQLNAKRAVRSKTILEDAYFASLR